MMRKRRKKMIDRKKKGREYNQLLFLDPEDYEPINSFFVSTREKKRGYLIYIILKMFCIFYDLTKKNKKMSLEIKHD